MNDIALDSRTGVSTDMTRRKKRNGRALILQLNEVKKQLNELQKSLEVLK
ncbi:hypothetical protein AB4Z21_25720 [Paenibacillus sp. MCAF20]